MRAIIEAVLHVLKGWKHPFKRAKYRVFDPTLPDLPDIEPTDRFYPEFERFREDAQVALAAMPVDELSYSIFDPKISSLFYRLVAHEELRRQLRSKRAVAGLAQLETVLAKAESKLKYKQSVRDKRQQEAVFAGDQYNRDQHAPQPRTPRVLQFLAEDSRVRRILTIGGLIWGLVVDVINFKGVLDLMNNTLTSLENGILAVGFSGIAAVSAAGLGRSLGHRARKDGQASGFQVCAYSIVLIGLCGTSCAIRGMHAAVVSSDPFGLGGAQHDVNLFGGVQGWLAAAFFTVVLIATMWATADEARLSTNVEYLAYIKTRRNLKRSERAVRRAQGKYNRLVAAYHQWRRELQFAALARDVAIMKLKSHTDELFADVRIIIAQQVAVPEMADSVSFAPTIKLPDDLPPMQPAFAGAGRWDEMPEAGFEPVRG